MAAARALVRVALTGAFAVTGFTALTFQVVWQRLIALHGGVDLYATTTVVAAFLLGLGMGSLLGGVVADRLTPRRCVLTFSAANAAVGAFALASPWLFYDLYRRVEPAVDGLAVSFAFHIALLVVPTTLMGLSLPLLARGLVRSDHEIAPLVGRLYSVNTFGAAAGAAVSGWWLLGTYGFVATIRFAALGNLSVAAIAAVLARSSRLRDEPLAVPLVRVGGGGDGAPAVETVAGDRRGRALFGDRVAPWFVLYGLTGAVALGLEVVFFRIIDAVMKSNSYSFAHVLSLYLLLFGLGSAIGSWAVTRVRRPEMWFLWLQCAAGVGAVVGVLALLAPLKLPSFAGVRPFLETYFASPGASTGFNIPRSHIVFANILAPLLVMVVPIGCFGAAFPFVQAVVARRVSVLGRHTGRLLFANIIGNVSGTLITGFVLIGRFGSAGTLRLLAVLLLIPGVAAALGTGHRRRPLLAVSAVLAVAVPVAVFPSNRGMWALLHVAPSDQFVVREDRSCLNALAGRPDGSQVLFINGSAQNAYPYDGFHVLIGLLPALLLDNPTHGLAVGLGMGGTTYGMAMDRRVEQVDTVEICGGELGLIEQLAASGKSPESADLLTDPRVSLRVGDGRKALLQKEENSLDIIVVDTLRPQSAYSGNLYSREFYDLVRSRLSAGGLFVQWIATPRTLTTLQERFPHVQAFPKGFAVASDSPVTVDPQKLRERLDAVDMSRFSTGLQNEIRVFFDAPDPQVRVGGQPSPAERRNEDLFPRDEYFLNNGF